MKNMYSLFLVLCAQPAWAQIDSLVSGPVRLELYGTAKVRATPMNVLNFRAVYYDPYIRYTAESNIQQASAGLRTAVSKGRLGVTYSIFGHYGPIHLKPSTCPVGTGCTPEEQKKFLLDQDLSLLYTLVKKKRFSPAQVTVGYGVLNTGEGFYLRNGPYDGIIDLRIRSVNVGLGFTPFGPRLPFWLGSNYFYHGLPNNRIDKTISFTIGAEYRLVQWKL